MTRRARRLFDSFRTAIDFSKPAGYRFTPALVSLEERDVPATFTVTNLNDTGAGSLRQALLDANGTAGVDDVVFQGGLTGTISLVTGQIPITEAVTVTGPGAATITVRNTQGAGTTARVFNIDLATAGTIVNMSGLTLTGGNATANGGGILNVDADLRLTGVTVTGNTSTGGGGIALTATAASLTLTDSRVTNNTVTGTGDGGGIRVAGASNVTLQRSTVSGNTSGDDGGGVYFYYLGTFVVNNSTISGNTAGSGAAADGGGVYLYSTAATISNSTISGNRAGRGGAIAAKYNETVTITNSTITANQALSTGANASGGITRTVAGTTTLTSTILAGNTGGVAGGADLSLTNNALNANNSLIGILGSATITGSGNVTGTVAVPVDPLLTALQDNGGPTLTHGIRSNSSLALNAGANPNGLATDQRGTGFPRVIGSQIDMGAVEGVIVRPSSALGTAPAVTLADAGATAYDFTIVYSATSPALVNVATLGNNDVTVTGPVGIGAVTPVTFVGATPSINAATVTATYRIVPPGGAWDSADSGTYTIAIPAGTVADTAGITNAAATLGTFTVAIPRIFTVTNTNDAGAGSLRQAVLDSNAAVGADIIQFAPGVTGTITLSAALSITQAVTITGPGAGALTVSGNNAVGVFNTAGAPAGAAINISGLTVANGRAATDGGGFAAGDEFLNLSRVVITGNSTGAGSQGGGVFFGGAGFLQLVDSTVSGNTSTEDGGGIYFYNGGSFNIVNSTISGNIAGTAGVGGGGIYFFGVASASPPVGFTPSTLSVTNSTISGNSAVVGGGIIATAFTGTLLVQSSTVTANSATLASGAGGGGIRITSGTLVLRNSVVAQNNTVSTVNTNPDITSGATVNANFNFIGVSSGGGLTLSGTSTNNLAGNAALGALADNGGPTLTHLPQVGSPLLNAGSNALIPVGLATDQRGLGFTRNFGPAIDLGSVEISPPNTAPVVTTSGGAAGYTENAPPVAIDGALTVVDNTSTQLTGATVQITGGYAPGQDFLAFTNMLGITATAFNAATGTLTLSGVATVANYQAALRTVTYVNTSDNPSTAPRTVTFTATDGALTSAGAIRLIGVTAVNDAPVAFASIGNTMYAENAAPVPIDAGLTVFDVDNAMLAGATVQITGGYAPGQDFLAFTNMLGITATAFDAATGTLTLSGVATVANYQAALRTVTYVNTSDNPSLASRTVSFVATDGTTPGAPVTKIIDITAVNDAATVTLPGAPVTFVGGGPAVIIASAATVIDPDSADLNTGSLTVDFAAGGTANDRLTIRDQGTGPGQIGVTGLNVTFGGTVIGTFTAGGGVGTTPLVITFNANATPAAAQALLRNIQFSNVVAIVSPSTRTVRAVVRDGDGGTSTAATKTVNVVEPSIPPVVMTTGGPTAYTENGAALAIDTGVTVTDVDSVNLVAATVQITGGYVMGEDVLAFTSANGITGTFDPATGLLTLEGTATVANYQLALQSVTYVNTSENPSVAPRTVSFTAADAAGSSTAADKTLTVTAVNDTPTNAAPGMQTTLEDAARVFSAANGNALAVADPDAGTSAVRVTLTATNGTVTLSGTTGLMFLAGDGTADPMVMFTGALTDVNAALNGLSFAPTGDFGGMATLRIETDDQGNTGGAALTDDDTVDIAVTPVSDAPAGADVTRTVVEDGMLPLAAADFGFSDPADAPADGFAGVVVATLPAGGALMLNGAAVTAGQFIATADLGNLMFVPTPDLAGPGATSFTFQVRDAGTTANGGAVTDPTPNTLAFDVTPINDQPTLTLAAGAVTATGPAPVGRDGFAVYTPGGGADENVQAPNFAVVAINPALFAVPPAIDAAGRLTFTPAPGAVGTTTVSVTAFDGGPDGGPNDAFSPTRTFTVTVQPVPVVAPPAPPSAAPVAPPVPLIAVGSAPGTPARVQLINSQTGAVVRDFAPFGGFAGGLRVALADVTGDGTDDLIVATASQIAVVAVFDGATGGLVNTFLPFSQFPSGAQIATGDVNGDGRADIVVGLDTGAPIAVALDGATGALLRVFAGLPGAGGTSNMAVGDFTGDGAADVAMVAGPGGNGLVIVFDGKTGGIANAFFAVPGFTGDISLGMGDIDGDGLSELVAGIQVGGTTVLGAFNRAGGLAKVYSAATGLGTPRQVSPGLSVSPAAQLAIADIDSDNFADLLVASPAGVGLSQMVAISGKTGAIIRTSVNAQFGAGSDVAAG